MANPEHVKILKQGVEAWNAWREQNPKISPDLSGEDLKGINLSKAHLAQVDLKAVNLHRADLHKADLSGAELANASLIKADLRHTDLTETGFMNASLSQAQMQNTHLSGTVFAGTNLSNVHGLEACHHMEPCFINTDTLLISGPLPLNFLRRCGVPERVINTFLGSATQTVRIPLWGMTYWSTCQAFAMKLCLDLQKSGVYCWPIEYGESPLDKPKPMIGSIDYVLVILSEEAITRGNFHLHGEHARNKGRVKKRLNEWELVMGGTNPLTIFITVDEVIYSSSVGGADRLPRTHPIGDFSHWKDHEAYQQAFDRFLTDLQSSEEEDSTNPPPANPCPDQRAEGGER